MKNALVFAGAFNPPTKAHIELADAARKAVHKDYVIFVPSKMTYIQDEQHKDFAFADTERYAMLKTIAKDHPWMIVSDHEITSEQQPRTYLTLCYLREQGYQCSLLFGSDKLPELRTGWLHVKEIAQEFGIVCMARADDDVEKMIDQDPYLRTLKEYITVIVTPDTWRAYSSTKARQYFMDGNEAELVKMLPDELNALRAYPREEEKKQ